MGVDFLCYHRDRPGSLALRLELAEAHWAYMDGYESRLIARLTDGVILVLRAGATNRATAMECRQQLALDGVPLLGTVLNDWNPSKSGSGGTYYTSGYYRYYSEARDK